MTAPDWLISECGVFKEKLKNARFISFQKIKNDLNFNIPS